jgi:hypothetical protein
MNEIECALMMAELRQAHPELEELIAEVEGKYVNSEEPVFRRFRASLRISGDGLDFDEITRTLGLTPTHTHRKGEQRKPHSKTWPNDAWKYEPQIDRERPLDEHIMAIWNAVRPQIPYLRNLKRNFKVDIFCGYRSNSSTAGFNVDHRCLGLFTELEIPFGVSVIIS